jgi:hypothetical protein
LLVRSIARGTTIARGKSLLPFWAPPSAGAKSHVFIINNKSYNKKVNELSREVKIQQIESELDVRNSCWQMDEYIESRMQVMMRPEDARECTFTPKVGTKMPKKYKELMISEYANWANNYIGKESTSFEVKKF